MIRFNFQHRCLYGLSALLLAINCTSYSLQEAPGVPSFQAEGSWNLEPAEGDVAVLGDFYFTGALDIIRQKNDTFDLKMVLIGNARSMGIAVQREFTLDSARKVESSANEIVATGIIRIDRSRRYQGPSQRLDDWEESKMGPWAQQITREQCLELSDVYCRRDMRLDFVAPDMLELDISRWSFAGTKMVFRKVVPPARSQTGGNRFSGPVFLIQTSQKTITITGNDVNRRLRNGTRIVVSNKGQVVAQGTVVEVFPTYARVKISSGLEAIRPRMNAIAN